MDEILGLRKLVLIIILFFLCSENFQVVYALGRNSFSFRNGYPNQYVSGSLHYFRVHPTDWRDRLHKLKWAGLHAVQTYVEWSSHEPRPGEYDFEGILDLFKFIKTADEEDLAVILRPGPFICAERDMGGLPFWLLALEPRVKLRTSDPRFMKYVKRWFDVLLPRLKPLMYNNGGPIVMVQVENEYGNCESCDFEYLNQLRNLLTEGLSPSPFLFATDNGRTEALKCSKIPSVFATVDFGPDANATTEFHTQVLFNGEGPLINSEFYTGWIDHWGAPHEKKSSEVVTAALDEMLSMGASVNIYVFHGGTSFGFGAGSNIGARFQSCPTSYDYDAPVSEAGDLAEKYFPIRNIIKKFFPVPSGPAPLPSPKYSYGDAILFHVGSVFNILPFLDSVEAKYPKTFEELNVPNGLVVYSYRLRNAVSSPCELSAFDTRDRGYVFVDQEFQGILSREEEIFSIPIIASPNTTITIVVESQGRVSVGPRLNDFKGLITTPLINGNSLEHWTMIPLPLYNMTLLKGALEQVSFLSVQQKSDRSQQRSGSQMMFYKGVVLVPDEETHPCDTFLSLEMFSKGYVWLNSFLLGRYWPIVGPQKTLYVPHGVLKKGENTILLLELEETILNGSMIKASFVNKPEIDGPTPVRR